ncbi:DUF3347 domain-containing protein [Aequorivita marina]|uniref:DUF3347 domain-containing protein n=1 Tax=Aequorivita marina TaxID=3073654 RepID=UPI0028767874|nr:DUF3347 domain-containing protein [Aequorivita sp. S2608]MDS1298218.1 DUF3347 domain-containing protein [Aequorivita sp. S2608]
MKKLSIVFLAVTALAFTACKDNSKQDELEVVTVDNSAEAEKTYEVAEVAAEFNDPKVEAAFAQYMEVEAALINTDAAKTASESSKLETLLKEMNAAEEIQTAATAMAKSDDIGVQREHFEALSTGVESILQDALKSGTIYKQYCPMAFNNKGAYWISTSKDILNPYFGDKMLKCGRVDAEIK